MTRTAEIDFVADATKPIAAPDTLRAITETGKRMLKGLAVVADLEERLKTAKAALREIQETQLPDLMESVGLSEIRLDTGQIIKVERIISASLTEAKRPDGIKWLQDHGHGGVVKMETTVSLPKGKTIPGTLLHKLEALGAEVVVKETVHHSTLKALVKELFDSGVEVPLDTLGVYVGRRATVK